MSIDLRNIESDNNPEWREFRLKTMKVGDDAEVIALITQVMLQYPNADAKAVAAWFSEACSGKKIGQGIS